MKSIIKMFISIVLCTFLIGCSTFKPTKKSTTSFNNVFTKINWNNATPYKKNANTTCTPTVLKLGLANLPKKIDTPKNLHKDIYTILNRMKSKIDYAIKTYDLKTKLTEDNGLITISAEDKIYNAMNNARNEKDFIKKVKTRRDGKPVDWKNKEKRLDHDLSLLYKTLWRTLVVKLDDKQVNNCKVDINQIIYFKDMTPSKIILLPYTILEFDCKCSEKSTKVDIESAIIGFSTIVEATFPNNKFDLNAMVFTYKGNPEYRIRQVYCCKDKTKDNEKD